MDRPVRHPGQMNILGSIEYLRRRRARERQLTDMILGGVGDGEDMSGLMGEREALRAQNALIPNRIEAENRLQNLAAPKDQVDSGRYLSFAERIRKALSE